MSLSATCCYYCGLFAAAAIVASAITIPPESQRAHDMIVVSHVTAAAVFGILAAIFKHRRTKAPARLLRALQISAILATILLFFGVVG